MEKITKNMTLGEVVERYPETLKIFRKIGLHCASCQMAMLETVEQGARAHGIKIKTLLKELNKVIKKK